jgi:cobalt/nickel transport system permease protein
MSTRRDLVLAGGASAKGGVAVWAFGLAIALALAVFSPLASAHPDGLEWVAGQGGFLDAARQPIYRVIPDYVFPGIPNSALATIVAGIIGTILVFGVAIAVAYLRRGRSRPA